MEFFSGLVLVIIAFVAGLFAGKVIAPNAARIKALEDKIDELKKQHTEYKNSVADHFSKSASLFGDMTEKYRSLHNHLSTGANNLCERRSVPRELSHSHVDILAVETPEIAENFDTTKGDQLKSNSISPDDYMVDVTRSGFSHLDPLSQKLNQENRSGKQTPSPETDNEQQKDNHLDQSSAKIIDLESQRTDDASSSQLEQAKDYAIKEEGVINHNSLNRDELIEK